jgi:hypothetical protein
MLSVDIARFPVSDYRPPEKVREARGWILDSASRLPTIISLVGKFGQMKTK